MFLFWLHSPFLLPPFLLFSRIPSSFLLFLPYCHYSPSSVFAVVPPPPFVVLSFLLLIFLSPLVVTVEQLALLQYRLSMSSMPCQPHAPPGSGTLHTYQVLLPFHSPPPLWGLLEVNLNQLRSQSRVLLLY